MGKTVKVRRANVVLTVNADDAERYLKKGFDVLDDNGNVASKAAPSDPGALAKAYEQHVAEIEALKAKVAELEAQLKAEPVKEEPEQEEPAEEVVEESLELPVEQPEEKKKPASRKKKA